MLATAQTEVRTLPLSALVLSQTPIQVERRAQFDQAALKELSATIKATGRVEQAITVRPNPFPENLKSKDGSPLFEVADGERRVIASKMAGLPEILVEVRSLSDEQVEQIQIVTGLQKEGLHELVEAEGYETLQKRGLSVDEIAAKCGKTKATIYARMKLLSLCPEARKALREEKLTASIALLVARIPGDDQQQRALKQLLEVDYHGRTMSYRDAARYVHETFMLKLSDAPFPRDDAGLVPSAGPCGACPMRTGNQPELFGDVKGADVCTNPPCFQAKKAAHIKRELEKAKVGGERVIRGGDARRILPQRHSYDWSQDGSHKQLRNGFARPRDKCLDDPKKRTYAELAGKDAPSVLLQNPDSGRVEKVFEISAISDRLKAKGVKPPPKAKDTEEQRQQDTARRELAKDEELAARRAIFRAIVEAAPAKLGREALAALMASNMELGFGTDIYEALGWEEPKTTMRHGDGRKGFQDRLLKLSEAELARLAFAFPLHALVLDTYEKVTDLEDLARRLKLDPKKIRADLRAAAAKPELPAKASKKKAAKK